MADDVVSFLALLVFLFLFLFLTACPLLAGFIPLKSSPLPVAAKAPHYRPLRFLSPAARSI